MEIKNFANAISTYKANSYEKINKAKPQKAAEVKNVDKVEFSSLKPDSITTLKTSIVKNVESYASPERIAQLKRQINDGEYHIPTEQISKAILEG